MMRMHSADNAVAIVWPSHACRNS